MAHDVGSLLRSTPTSPCTSSFFSSLASKRPSATPFTLPSTTPHPLVPACATTSHSQRFWAMHGKPRLASYAKRRLRRRGWRSSQRASGRRAYLTGAGVSAQRAMKSRRPILSPLNSLCSATTTTYHFTHPPARARRPRRAPPPARPRAAPRAFPSQSARSSFPQNTPLYKIITEPTGLSAAITRVSAAPVRRRGSLAHPILPDRHEHLEDIPHTAHCKPLAMGFMRFAPFSGHRWPKHGHTRKRCCASVPTPGAKSVLPACHGLALKYKSHCLSLRLSLPSHTLCANLSRLRMGIKSDISKGAVFLIAASSNGSSKASYP